jgi:hypothetical protein
MTEDKPKTGAKTGSMLVKLASAGVNDKFLVPQGSGDPIEITPQGVEVPAGAVDGLLEVAIANGVALVVTEAGQEAKK